MDTDRLYDLEASVQNEALQLAKDVNVVCYRLEDNVPVDDARLTAITAHITAIREMLTDIEQAIDEILSS